MQNPTTVAAFILITTAVVHRALLRPASGRRTQWRRSGIPAACRPPTGTYRVLGYACGLAAAVLLAAPGSAAPAPSETLTPLLQQAIPTMPGKTLTSVNVTFPPGARSQPHRHGMAFLYAYVLAGDIRSQIEGQPLRTYHTGDSWTEKPGDHHVLTENASSIEPARLLVVFISNDGDALKTDDP